MTAPPDEDGAGNADGDGDGDDEDAPVAGAAAEHRFTVEPSRAGERIDALIADLVPALSRAAVQRLIDDARVRLNDATVAKAGQREAAMFEGSEERRVGKECH